MFELLFKYPYTVYEKGSLVLQTGWSVWWWVAATLLAAVVVGWLLFTKWNNGKRAKAIVLWTLQSTMIAIVLLLLWQPGKLKLQSLCRIYRISVTEFRKL